MLNVSQRPTLNPRRPIQTIERSVAEVERWMVSFFWATGRGQLRREYRQLRRTIAYCTVTSVPIGISEKNLRAASSGNRMQPCEAG
jgi:hypothetical protein